MHIIIFHHCTDDKIKRNPIRDNLVSELLRSILLSDASIKPLSHFYTCILN